MWPYDMDTGASRSVDRSADLAGWEREAYANVPVTIQWDDGHHTGPAPGRVPTSSASMPSVVSRMLADLDVFPDAHVLEVGTGTGWNAGLLSARLDWRRFGSHVGTYPGDAAEEAVSVTLADLGEGRRFHGAKFVMGLCVPDCAHVLNTDRGESTLWFFDMAEGSRSWASVVFRAGEAKATVHQSGPRRLWDEVSRALEWWRGLGSPQVDSFGLTVTPEGAHRPWLADPSRPVPSFAAE
ncbi:hypothetical protein C7M71_003595 [Peterkaempfera bronchialis]|uniref:Protein-L-isoaspartate O-methyltransferase n=2 Tax=Peterkaempfera bronchialis TaxID=2126346 RepID=A0A345T584_9ACTN|nr:hypothetical protein C7M71_003595 [Peterkaempfera bronchialis]